MNRPMITVIIPAYNGVEYLGEAIHSVLEQTSPTFEVVVVDDASTDGTADLVRGFTDPRVRLIRHERNQGPNAARKTGLEASRGDLIALLDQDDLFHRDKLRLHAELFAQRPEVGFSYNNRFEIDGSSSRVFGIWRPGMVGLKDVVLGFPISPSQMVIARRWASDLKFFDDWVISGGEYTILGGLMCAGCRGGYIDRALNYRRFHFGRILGDLPGRCAADLGCLDRVFSNPRCPSEIGALRGRAFRNTYLRFSHLAFLQDEADLGRDFVRAALRFDPSIAEGNPSELAMLFLSMSISYEGLDHGALLEKIFSGLPPDLDGVRAQLHWAVARGYLLRGARSIIWGQIEPGRQHLARARSLEATIDDSFVGEMTSHLLDYETEFGSCAVEEVLHHLSAALEESVGRKSGRGLEASFWLGRAFKSYLSGQVRRVPKEVREAIWLDKKYLLNRGVWSIYLRSALGHAPARTGERVWSD